MSQPAGTTDAAAAHGPDGPGLRDYLRLLYKRKEWIVGPILLVVGATTLLTFRQTKIYVATATVVVESTPPRTLGRSLDQVVDLGSTDYWSSQEYLATQLQLVRSRSTSEDVVRDLGLNRDKNFTHGRSLSVASAADILRSKLLAELGKNSRTVKISVSDPDPTTAQLLANAVAAAYVRQNLERKFSSTVEAVEWLSKQLGTIQGDLERSEMALHRFKIDNNVLSLDLDERQNVIANQITRLTEELTTTKTQRMHLAAREGAVDALQGRDPLDLPGPPIVDSELISQLKSTYAQLRVEDGDLSSRYGEQHPKRIAVNQRLRATKEDIEREINNLLAGLRTELQIQTRTESQIASELDRVTQEALQLNAKEHEYRWLERETNNNEKMYAFVLQRTRETDLARAEHANNIWILDKAERPKTASSPRVVLNLAIAAGLSILLGIGLALLREQLDNTVKGQVDVEQRLGQTFLGLIPSITQQASKTQRKRRGASGISRERDLFVRDNPKSQVAECCRSIRTNLSFISPDKQIRSLLVTSAAPQDGKTTAAVSMGIVMAESGSRVVLVDTDMRRPRLHRVFGVSSEVGVSNLLVDNEVRLADVVKSTDIPGLSVIPCGPAPPNPAELLGSRRFRELVQELTQRFDRVILDSPPVIAVTDPAIIGTVADGTLLIGKAHKTTLEMASHAIRQLTDVGSNLLGMVLNDVDLSFSGYAYYQYRYGYYYGEGTHREISENAPVGES